jgi:type IV pilus assembly protein PilE
MSSGFTLIELMITITIVALLTAIAYPSYLEQVRKSRRADATSSLMDGSQLLERCFTRLNAYNDGACPDPTGASSDGYYTISFDTDEPTVTTYTLVATPTGDQANDNCGTFTLDHLGNKTPTPDGNRCWGS